MDYMHIIKDNQHKKVWKHSFENELGRLAQGVGKTFKGMDTIFYVDYNKIPSEHHKRIKYGRIVVDY